MGDSTIDALKRQIADKEGIIAEDPSSTRGKLAATSRDRMLEQLSRAESTDVNNPNAYEYHGIDTVTGNQLYLNNITLKYKLSDSPPTTDQAATYKSQNPPSQPTTSTAEPPPAEVVKEQPLTQAETDKIEERPQTTSSSTMSTDTLPDPGSGNGFTPGALAPLSLGPNGNLSNTQNLGIPNIVPKSEADIADSINSASQAAEDEANISNTSAPSNGTIPGAAPGLLTENLLHNFASYTYSLSLHAISKDAYTNVIKNPGSYIPKHVLISSAGKFGENFTRQDDFKEDFFFSKLSIDTIIGMSSQSRNSNAVLVDFTLIEPYGMTFFTRLGAMTKALDFKNYTELPYMLQIDFYGYDDAGIPKKIANISKFIPIRIILVKMKVSDKGAEYEVSAVPFNHLGFSDVVATTPFKLEVTAKNLTEFFSLGTDSATSVNSEPSMITDATHRQEALDDNARSTAATFTGGQDLRKENELKREALMKSGIRVKSYTGAMNTWLTDVKAQAQADFADTILFEIVDPEIKDKQNFVSKDKIGIPNRQMGDKTNPQSGIRTMMGDDNHPTTLVTINQGSSVIDTITLAMLGTEYIQEQLIDPDDSTITDSDIEAKLKKPLKWFKIIPTVLLGEYDEKRKTYAKTFIYKIIKFEHYDTKSIYAPKGAPPGYVKDYSYIFTGNNKDILNLDLSFDTLFYVAMNLKPGNQPKVTGQKSAEFDKNQITTREKIAKANAKLIQNVDEFSHKTVYTSGSGMVSNQDVKSLTARELQRNLLNTALGDMISLKLKIVGDPDFIKQDDFFFPSDSSPYLNRLRTQNLSILTDASSIYANVTFNTAEDYSEDGLAIPGGTGKYSSGTFSGIYQIIQVKNTFDGGKFEQELDLIRYENQLTVDDQNAATSSVNEERIDTNSPEMAAIMDCRPDVTGPPIPAGLTPPTVAIPKTAAEMATLVPSGSKSITSGSLLEKLPTMSAIPKLPVIPPGTPSIGPLPAGAQYGTPLSETEYRRILGGSN